MQAVVAEQPAKSTHKVEVVPVALEKHPNADSLSVVRAFGYTCCVRTADWQGVGLAAYLPPDSVVDVRRPEFAFLADQAKGDGRARIKAKKLRGVVSFGLLVPAPDGAREGADVADRLGVTHYEPPLEHEKGQARLFLGGETAPSPRLPSVGFKYDVDAFRRYHHLFTPGEPVVVTEKLDGANARYVWHDGRMHCGSRAEWKKEFPSYDHLTVDGLVAQGLDAEKARDVLDRLHAKPKQRNLWWDVLSRTPALERFCRDHPDVVVYGECYGNVNAIKYGLPDGNRFAAFDVMRGGQWLDAEPARDLLFAAEVPTVPLAAFTVGDVGRGTFDHVAYDFDAICALAEGPTLVAGAAPGTIREGVVVKPARERSDPHVGRVCFKAVSGAYLEKYR